MDRRSNQYRVYPEVPREDKLSLWRDINQGRTAYETLVDYANTRRTQGRNGTALAQVEAVLSENSVPFLLTPPIEQAPKPTTLTQAANQITIAQGTYSEIIRLNAGLVRTLANRNSAVLGAGLGLTLADLQGYGQIGLVQAANRYDHNAGVDFGAYANRRIEGAMKDAVRDLSPYSRDEVSRLKMIDQVIQDYWIQKGRAPTLDELKKQTGLDEETMNEVTFLSGISVISLSTATGGDFDEGGRPIVETTLKSEDENDTHDRLSEMRRAALLRKALKCEDLDERDLLAVKAYYFDNRVMKDIADELGVSNSRVSQILEAARAKLAIAIGRNPYRATPQLTGS